MDQATKFDNAENTALASRRDLVVGNKVLRLKGRLSTDIGSQPLLIPSQTDVTIKLTPQRNEFSILKFDTDNNKYKIKIVAAKLSVRKVKLYPEAVNDFEKHIAKIPARIPISQVKVNTLSIPQGLTSYEHNSLYNGILPNYIVIGLVTNSSYSGNVTNMIVLFFVSNV